MIEGVEVTVGAGVFEGRGGSGVSAMGRASFEGFVGADTDSVAQELCTIIKTNGRMIFNPRLKNNENLLVTNR